MTRARLAQSVERRSTEQVVETATALIELLKAKYGLADYRTINSQADLVACLRKCDGGDRADKLLHEINKGLDAVEERMNAMHLSSSSRQA
ncbi:uncharacterized protein PG998_012222 [Apiospora kogelbergensis]|uniref:Uncharacterized protein n=1 Tax=Apiospora kogelbergensis TaxID=1337665 RepID=A0AAW0QS85_9PEZI